MKTMPISLFKAQCIAVLRQAYDTGEALIVTRRGRPIARIEPVSGGTKQRKLGVFKGRMKIQGDIVHADTTADWDMLA